MSAWQTRNSGSRSPGRGTSGPKIGMAPHRRPNETARNTTCALQCTDNMTPGCRPGCTATAVTGIHARMWGRLTPGVPARRPWEDCGPSSNGGRGRLLGDLHPLPRACGMAVRADDLALGYLVFGLLDVARRAQAGQFDSLLAADVIKLHHVVRVLDVTVRAGPALLAADELSDRLLAHPVPLVVASLPSLVPFPLIRGLPRGICVSHEQPSNHRTEAEPGFAPGTPVYEAGMILFHYPAMMPPGGPGGMAERGGGRKTARLARSNRRAQPPGNPRGLRRVYAQPCIRRLDPVACDKPPGPVIPGGCVVS